MGSLSMLLKLTRLVVDACYRQAIEFYVTRLGRYSKLLQNKASKKTNENDPSPPLALCVENITSAWLTHILQEKGWLEKYSMVQSFSLEPFGEVGNMSSMYRLQMVTTKNKASSAFPTTLIVKTNDKSLKGRVTSSLTRVNEGEVGFYRDLSSSSSSTKHLLPHPRAAFYDLDATTGNSLILMEEVTKVTSRKLGEDPLSLPQAKAYLSDLARMHAHYWNHPQLKELEWLKNNTTKRAETWGAMVSMIWNSTGRKRMAKGKMTKKQLATVERFVHKTKAYCRCIDARNYTLCHGDLNPFNLLVTTTGDSSSNNGKIWTIDWQTLLRGNWSQDVAYFFMANVKTGQEEELLEHYRKELEKHGVSMSKKETNEEFVLGNVFILLYFCMGAGVLQEGNPAEEKIWSFFVGRVSYCVDKYNLAEVIESL